MENLSLYYDWGIHAEANHVMKNACDDYYQCPWGRTIYAGCVMSFNKRF